MQVLNERPYWNHYNPVKITRGSIDSIGKIVYGDKILLVTSPGFTQRGVVDRLSTALRDRSLSLFDSVKPNPDLKELSDVADSLGKKSFNCVIGLGGGSAIDTAKVLAACLPNLSLPLEYIIQSKSIQLENESIPLLAIPTTSGTGSEVTPFATVWDHSNSKKHSLAGDFVFPKHAFLDAHLTLSLNEQDTLYPALDSISHALESIWNKNRTPVSAAFAMESLRISVAALPRAMMNPTNLEAREKLQNAALLSGLAISQTRTAIAHAMSYPLTLRYGVPHGLACSFSLVAIIEHFLSFSSDPELVPILTKVSKLLTELDLDKRLGTFMKPPEVSALIASDCEYDSRSLNYIFSTNLELSTLLSK